MAVQPISIRWISLVPSKMVKIVDYRAVSAGQPPVRGPWVSARIQHRLSEGGGRSRLPRERFRARPGRGPSDQTVTGFLLDTNVPSELTRPQSDANVEDWLDAADDELRRLIREGFESGIPGEQLADAAGLSVPRVYQIRDGRR